MRIKMLKTVPGSVDGIRVEQYEEGKEYDLSYSSGAIDLASALVGAKLAVAIPVMQSPAVYIDSKAIQTVEASKPLDFSKTFDPETSTIEEVRAYLEANGQKPHHKTGEAKLRELALEVATR